MRRETKAFGALPGALRAAIAPLRTPNASRSAAGSTRVAARWIRLGIAAVGVAGLAAAAASLIQHERRRRERTRQGAQLDEALSQTFPASDPPAITRAG